MFEGLTVDRIDEVIERAAPFVGDIGTYTHSVFRRTIQEQPILYKVVKNAHKRLVIDSIGDFAMGAALTYEILPLSETQRLLSKDVLRITVKNLEEHSVDQVLEFDWFVDILQTKIPDYADWLGAELRALPTYDRKTSFMLGGCLMIMPFCIRSENEHLEGEYSS
jgi:hypothetical protein